jgi:MFS family permease
MKAQPIVLGAISLDLFAVLFGGATALLPIYARDILSVGPEGLGALRSAPAIGAAITAILLGLRPLKRQVGRTLFIAVGVFGIATVVFGVSTNFWLSMVALAALGAADEVSVVVRLTLVQLSTPDEMRGRVAAVNSIFIGASNELGEFESGVAAKLLGPEGAVVFGGLATLLVTILWMRWFPGLRKADRFEDYRA